MTASTTPRLGLLLPASSDTFAIADFDDTMSKLDSRPGILPVANYAALPSGLTTAQHGTQFLALDTLAQWMWNKPGSGAGTWVRTNTVGKLVRTSQSSAISTTATTSSAAPTAINTTFTAPGGRDIAVVFFATSTRNDGSYGLSSSVLQVNNVDSESQRTGARTNFYDSAFVFYTIPAPAPGASINLKIKVFADGSSGGTTTMNFSMLYAWEQ